MKIPFHKPYITNDEISSVSELLKAGWLTAGNKTLEFEKKFKEYVGSGHAVSVNSATAAMHLSLASAGIRKDDQVLVPALTFAATAEVVRYFDAWPVLVDVERGSHLIDPAKIEQKITEQTRAIMPVHFGGQPCDMDEICAIAKKYNLFVIEDAAHSIPAWYRGRKVGTIGDATCFSFYATKTLTTGEGGMICTDNDEWAKRMAVLRLHGIDRDAWSRVNSPRFWQYDVVEVGFKYNTTDIASAMGVEQLRKVEFMWEKRKRIADLYTAAFKNREEIILPLMKSDRVSSWYLYAIELKIEALKIGRDRFIEEMLDRGVALSVHFIPLYEFSYYRKLGYTGADCPNSNWIFERTVSLPIYPGMDDSEIAYVIDAVLGVIKKFKK